MPQSGTSYLSSGTSYLPQSGTSYLSQSGYQLFVTIWVPVICHNLVPVPDAKFHEAKSDYLGPLIVTPEMTAKKIKAVKDNKSQGVDGIPPRLLMETVEQISMPLARVFNLSLKEGVVPFEWKEANIIPLFKKGSRNKSKNYRPVSLTSVICKLLERLIKDNMVDILVKHKLLNSSQHGFLKARSCLTNMLCFFEEITKWIDEGSFGDIIYLDMRFNNFRDKEVKRRSD